MRRHGLPALMPDRAGAEHGVKLRLPSRSRRGVVEARPHADTVERRLRMTLDRVRRLDSERIQDCRHEVDRVRVLVANLAARLSSGRPGDDAGVAGSAVELIALPHLE